MRINRLCYFKDDAEIDLVVERPGLPILFIEIKSSSNVVIESLSTFSNLAKDFDNCEAVCFSKDKYAKQFDNILVMPWQDGIKEFFTEI